MAAAFARRALNRRGLDSQFELVTGGTRPADHIHPGVVESMEEVGIDISDRSPQTVSTDQLQKSDYVITMGCSAADICPAGWGGENRDWNLPDPEGRPADAIASIRDEIEQRVEGLFDELAGSSRGIE